MAPAGSTLRVETINVNAGSNRARDLERLLRERIVVLDGAMGTMIQQRRLGEADFRGERFKVWPGKDLKGNNDLLNLTQPGIIEEIHRHYLEAGADIIETNTFNSQAISLGDYGMESLAYELSRAGAVCARRAADRVMAAQPGRGLFRRRIHRADDQDLVDQHRRRQFGRARDHVRRAGRRLQRAGSRALLDGGADLLLVETIFDTLNGKAAFFAILNILEERGLEPFPCPAAGARSQISNLKSQIPILASVTFIQAGSNRGVTGQTVEAFWNSISHVPLLSVGMNCALGPKEIRPLIEELSAHCPDFCQRLSECRTAESAAADRFSGNARNARAATQGMGGNGWLNIVGGCCGTTPAHIQAIAEAVRGVPPRALPRVEPWLRLSLRLSRARKRLHAEVFAAAPRLRQLHQHRRTDERYRFAEIRQADQGGRLTKRRWPSPASRSRTARRSST